MASNIVMATEGHKVDTNCVLYITRAWIQNLNISFRAQDPFVELEKLKETKWAIRQTDNTMAKTKKGQKHKQ